MVALTDTERDGMARRAVDDVLKALSAGGQEQVANACVAGMLYLYQRTETASVPKLYETYRGHLADRKPDPGARLTVALCLIREEKLDDAYAHLAGVVQDSPTATEAPKAALLRGWISLREQNYERARRDLTSVASAYPGTPYADQAKKLLAGLPEK
jgi:hypothetical protein